MTPSCLSNKQTPFKLFLFTLKKDLPLMLLAAAFMAIICPGMLLSHISSLSSHLNAFHREVNIQSAALLILFATTFISSACAFIVSLVNFSYLYKKPACDLFHAMPITRTALLTARFSAAIVSSLLPMLVSYLSLSLIGLLPHVVVDQAFIWKGFLLTLTATLATATSSLLFQLFAGNLFSFFASVFCFNAGVPAFLLLTQALCSRLWYGFSADWSMVLRSTPSLYSIVPFIALLNDDSHFLSWDVLWSALLSIGLFVLAILFYNLRKSEKAGQTYAYRVVYWIVSGLIGFFAGFLLAFIFSGIELSWEFWVYGAVGALLATISFGAISDKGFKTIKRSLAIGGCAYAVLMLYFMTISFDWVGYQRYVPAPDQVASVEIEDIRIGRPIILYNATTVTQLHQALVTEEFKEDEDTDAGATYYTQIAFTYQMKNGQSIKREYRVYGLAPGMFYHQLLCDQGYQAAVLKKFEAVNTKPFVPIRLSYHSRTHGTGSAHITCEKALEILKLYFKTIEEKHLPDPYNAESSLSFSFTHANGEYEHLRLPFAGSDTAIYNYIARF